MDTEIEKLRRAVTNHQYVVLNTGGYSIVDAILELDERVKALERESSAGRVHTPTNP